MDKILTILGSVGFNWHVALANFFNFLIILFLLNFFFFKKIGKTIDDRHKIIEKGLNNARDAEKALANAKEERDILLREAHKKETELLQAAHIKADELAHHIKVETDAMIAEKKAALKKEEEELTVKVEKAFSERAPKIVASLYEKSLLRDMTEDENNAFIARLQK